ncbi:hypothetical protein Pmani_015456 [Petrolisthes manimaculis]|uniref:Uncharacterized protein n=1 Tax=Petrolisthes manimaculis TaxID=1843537 RepID=A0AAE1U7N3_9EUCA|nr:hypothetical protein Pmani_015456 [Petrolisthes manimaculis]
MVVSRVVGVVLGLVCVVAGVVLAVVMLVLFSNNNNNNKETGEGGIMSGREKQGWCGIFSKSSDPCIYCPIKGTCQPISDQQALCCCVI